MTTSRWWRACPGGRARSSRNEPCPPGAAWPCCRCRSARAWSAPARKPWRGSGSRRASRWQRTRSGHVVFERLPLIRTEDGAPDTSKGLLALPDPSPGDLFLDLEGDPFALDDGVDYLFGILEPGRLDADGQPLFHAFWSRDEDGRITPEAEQRAFERTIDLIIERLDADPTLHVYHYASYEPIHLGLLMGRYGTREEEVDRLMRGNVLVDLFSVVRQGLRVGVESYSIKKLEPLYGYVREVDLRDAGSSIVAFETWLEVGGESGQDDETLERIERYNRDDVVSTWLLRDWLEGQRAELEHELGSLSAPAGPRDGEASEQLSEWLAKVRETADQLAAGLPEDPDAWDQAQRGRWLLAQLLEWHRREEKPGWWRYFHLLEDLTDEERREEPEPLAMLELVGRGGRGAAHVPLPLPAPGARDRRARGRGPGQPARPSRSWSSTTSAVRWSCASRGPGRASGIPRRSFPNSWSGRRSSSRACCASGRPSPRMAWRRTDRIGPRGTSWRAGHRTCGAWRPERTCGPRVRPRRTPRTRS